MCDSNGCSLATPKQPTFGHSKRWTTSTGASTPPFTRKTFTSWPCASSSVKPKMFCSSARPASAKLIWPRPSATKPSARTSWCSTVPSSTWSGIKDEAFNQQDKTLRRYLKPDLLIIDDMGLKQLPKNSGEYLLEVVMRRYENRATIMTSNRPLEEWGKLLSDVPTAGAILDRFLHHAQVIAITGRSYRVKDQALRKENPENKSAKTPNETAND